MSTYFVVDKDGRILGPPVPPGTRVENGTVISNLGVGWKRKRYEGAAAIREAGDSQKDAYWAAYGYEETSPGEHSPTVDQPELFVSAAGNVVKTKPSPAQI